MVKKRVTGIKFKGNTIKGRIDGKKCFDFIKYSPRVPMVGHYKQKHPVLLIDKKIKNPMERKALAVHEMTERCLRYHEGIRKSMAHHVATAQESKFEKQIGVNDRRYVRNVERVFRKNYRKGQRRKR